MAVIRRTIVIERRFSGPPELGNGGYVAGVLGRVVGGAATVTLRAPIPLETPLRLTVERGGGEAAHGVRQAADTNGNGEEAAKTAGTSAAPRGTRTNDGRGEDGANAPPDAGTEGAARGPDGVVRVELRHADALLAEAAPDALDLVPPPPPDRTAALAASERYPGRAPNPYQECFVCGFARAPGSGLRVFAGPTGVPDLVAAAWTVHPGLADEGGAIPEEYLWGALDCPGAFSVGGARARDLRLGRMTARIFGRVRPGEPCTVTGWRIGGDRRKHFTGTAVYGETGGAVAVARAVWIEPRPAETAGLAP